MAAFAAAGSASFASLPPALISQRTVQYTLRRILNPSEEESENRLDQVAEGASVADVSLAVSGLSSVLLESAKHDLTASDFKAALQDKGVATADAEQVSEEYERSKPALRKLLARTQFSLPNLTGVQWRLDHVVQSKHLSHLNEPVFMLRFNILQSNGREEPLEVTCSEEQLRDLYSTLSQASHQVTDTLKKMS